jgi:hypothetical protein
VIPEVYTQHIISLLDMIEHIMFMYNMNILLTMTEQINRSGVSIS